MAPKAAAAPAKIPAGQADECTVLRELNAVAKRPIVFGREYVPQRNGSRGAKRAGEPAHGRENDAHAGTAARQKRDNQAAPPATAENDAHAGTAARQKRDNQAAPQATAKLCAPGQHGGTSSGQAARPAAAPRDGTLVHDTQLMMRATTRLAQQHQTQQQDAASLRLLASESAKIIADADALCDVVDDLRGRLAARTSERDAAVEENATRMESISALTAQRDAAQSRADTAAQAATAAMACALSDPLAAAPQQALQVARDSSVFKQRPPAENGRGRGGAARAGPPIVRVRKPACDGDCRACHQREAFDHLKQSERTRRINAATKRVRKAYEETFGWGDDCDSAAEPREREATLLELGAAIAASNFDDLGHAHGTATPAEAHCLLFSSQVAHHIAASDFPLTNVLSDSSKRRTSGWTTPAARVLLPSMGWTSGRLSHRVGWGGGAKLATRTPDESRSLQDLSKLVWHVAQTP